MHMQPCNLRNVQVHGALVQCEAAGEDGPRLVLGLATNQKLCNGHADRPGAGAGNLRQYL